MLTKFTFINEELIPQNYWEKAESLVDIDLDNIDFVALTKYLKGNLWTGDKQDKNYIRFVAAHNKNLERSSY